MQEGSPYSTDVVFLAQLVIITAYSACAAVNTTIRNATNGGVLSLSLSFSISSTRLFMLLRNLCAPQQPTSYL